MTGKIDMSLDEIIKSNKKNFPRQKRNNAGGNKQRPGNKGGAPRNNTSPKKSVGNKPGAKPGGKPNSKPVSKPGGGVLRGRKQGGITRNSRPANFTSGRNLPSYKREAFLGAAPRRFGSSSEATKLIVSNLDFGVTDSDILELFGEFGPLKSAGVHYDRSGRSLGSADLIYERRADAIKAMKQYNGVPLDGREMNIQLATSEIPNSNPIRAGNRLGNSNFNKPRAPANNRNRPGGNRGPAGAKARPQQQQGGNNKKKGGAAGKGGKKPKPAPPTAEELDAQLEEYVKAKVTSSEGA